MAAASGDMRRALEACTAALELRVQEAVAEQADLAVNALLTSKCLTNSQICCCLPPLLLLKNCLLQHLLSFALPAVLLPRNLPGWSNRSHCLLHLISIIVTCVVIDDLPALTAAVLS